VQTDHRVTLDDLMRALWAKFGKPGGRLAGYVDNPYTSDDVRRTLGEIVGNQMFADEFFRRYIQGRDVVDYETLLAKAGLVWRPVSSSRASIGVLRLQEVPNGVRLAAASPFGSAAFNAGLDRDDVIVAVGEVDVRDAAGFSRSIERYTPGQSVPITFERNGRRQVASVTIEEDRRRELVPAENTGVTLTEAQRRFRTMWLSPSPRNSF
jgi:predicted metalloprotease with PDZ domain